MHWRIQRCLRRVTPPAMILLYHRVGVAANDPYALSVTPAHFDEQMRVVRRAFVPTPLHTLAQRLWHGLWPVRSVAVTFDDGYADNLLEAKPILERYGIPATVFVASGYGDAPVGFWWDELEDILQRAPRLPGRLQMTLAGHTHVWTIRTASDEAAADRRVVVQQLAEIFSGLSLETRCDALKYLAVWAGTSPARDPAQRPLALTELTELERDGLVRVGGHTVSHPSLGRLFLGDQRFEIVDGKRRLEKALGHPVTAFAYPFGTYRDYTADTVRLVKEAGFQYACANFSGPVRCGIDPFQLPRFVVGDWDGDEFARRLMGWLKPQAMPA